MLSKAFSLCVLLFEILPASCQTRLFNTSDGRSVFLGTDKPWQPYRSVKKACHEQGLEEWYIPSNKEFSRLQSFLNTKEFESALIWVMFRGYKRKRTNFGYFRKFGATFEHPWTKACGPKADCPILAKGCPAGSHKKGKKARLHGTGLHRLILYDCNTPSYYLCTEAQNHLTTQTSTPIAITNMTTTYSASTTTAPPPTLIATTPETKPDIQEDITEQESSTKCGETLSSTVTMTAMTPTGTRSTTATTTTVSTTAVTTSTKRPITTTLTPGNEKNDNADLCPCPQTVRTNISMIELTKIMDKARKILAVDITVLSSTRRKLGSAKDDRTSSFLMSLIAMIIVGFLYVLIMLNDLFTMGYRVHRSLRKLL